MTPRHGSCRRPWQADYGLPSTDYGPGGARQSVARRRTVQTDAQIGPPMLNVAAAFGFFTCNPAGALPRSCCADHPIIATPVAPIGCPLAMRPPELLIAHSPATFALPSTQ